VDLTVIFSMARWRQLRSSCVSKPNVAEGYVGGMKLVAVATLSESVGKIDPLCLCAISVSLW